MVSARQLLSAGALEGDGPSCSRLARPREDGLWIIPLVSETTCNIKKYLNIADQNGGKHKKSTKQSCVRLFMILALEFRCCSPIASPAVIPKDPKEKRRRGTNGQNGVPTFMWQDRKATGCLDLNPVRHHSRYGTVRVSVWRPCTGYSELLMLGLLLRSPYSLQYSLASGKKRKTMAGFGPTATCGVSV